MSLNESNYIHCELNIVCFMDLPIFNAHNNTSFQVKFNRKCHRFSSYFVRYKARVNDIYNMSSEEGIAVERL